MKIGFIGLGHMGRAIASGLINGGVIDANDVFGYAPHTERLAAYAAQTGIRACKSAKEVCAEAETVIIAVKPYVMDGLLDALYDDLRGKAVISVALGYDYVGLSRLVSGETRVQFVMPNTPAMVGEGVLLFEDKSSLKPDERAELIKMFSALGEVIELPSRLMGIGGTISGCGPAFAAMIIEALADAGVKYGLPRATAYHLAAQTLAGTGKMQIGTGMLPAAIKDGVCSPAGSTIRGVEALERAGLRAALFDAVNACMNMKMNNYA